MRMGGFTRVGYLAAVLSMALPAYGDSLRVHSFMSSNTALAPEMNLILENRGTESLKVYVDLGSAQQIGIDTCKLIAERQGATFETSTSIVSGRFDAFESVLSAATVPPNSFIHRYIPLGSGYRYPCVRSYLVRAESGQLLATGKLEISGKPILPSLTAVKKDEVSFSYSVERFERSKTVLAAALFTNRTPQSKSLLISEKRLTGCNAGFEYERSVRQGLDGSVLNMPPLGSAVALTAVRIKSWEQKCVLELTVRMQQRSEKLVDGEQDIVDRVRIPLEPKGVYLPFSIQ